MEWTGQIILSETAAILQYLVIFQNMGIIDGWGMYVLLYGEWDECVICPKIITLLCLKKKKKNFQHIVRLQIT